MCWNHNCSLHPCFDLQSNIVVAQRQIRLQSCQRLVLRQVKDGRSSGHGVRCDRWRHWGRPCSRLANDMNDYDMAPSLGRKESSDCESWCSAACCFNVKLTRGNQLFTSTVLGLDRGANWQLQANILSTKMFKAFNDTATEKWHSGCCIAG